MRHGVGEDLGATQISALLFRRATGQVARAGLAMLHLAVGRQAEPLLRTFVRFLLRHKNTRRDSQRPFRKWEAPYLRIFGT